MFNTISSSSEDEDERDHHDDEDLNIMDTEEDLERRLQGKMNESDGPEQESGVTNQIGETSGACCELFCGSGGWLNLGFVPELAVE